jgi:uncharacterized membrane protein YbaN (DUF454 family)
MRGLSEKIKRIIYVLAGTVFLFIGAIGVVIPVLPTTPFLLLAAACYLRGSKRLHHWMLNNQIFGEFLKNYSEGKGITRRNKLLTAVFLWSAISFSVIFFVINPVIKGLLVLIAIAVSIHLFLLPTFKQK